MVHGAFSFALDEFVRKREESAIINSKIGSNFLLAYDLL